MTKHKSIDEIKEAMTKYIYVSVAAQSLGLSRQAVYHRISTNKQLKKHVEKIHRKLLPLLYPDEQD